MTVVSLTTISTTIAFSFFCHSSRKIRAGGLCECCQSFLEEGQGAYGLYLENGRNVEQQRKLVAAVGVVEADAERLLAGVGEDECVSE